MPAKAARTFQPETGGSVLAELNIMPADVGQGEVSVRIQKLRLLTNNPKKIVGIEGYGLRVVERVPLEVTATDANRRYLATKRDKLGHMFSFPD